MLIECHLQVHVRCGAALEVLILDKRLSEIFEDVKHAVEQDNQGNSRLFLKVTGTTDDYRILYDTEAVKKKIVSDLKEEVEELKDAFRSKGKKKEKEVEVSKEEYFDW